MSSLPTGVLKSSTSSQSGEIPVSRSEVILTEDASLLFGLCQIVGPHSLPVSNLGSPHSVPVESGEGGERRVHTVFCILSDEAVDKYGWLVVPRLLTCT